MVKKKKNADSKQLNFKLIWFFLKPYKLQIFGLFILSAIIGFLEAATVAAIYPIVSLGMDMGSGPSNFLLSMIEKIAEIFPLEDVFISYCILIIILVILGFLVKAVNTYFSAYISSNAVRVVKERLFRKQLAADYQYFLDEKQGSLIYTTTTATSDVWFLVTSVAEILSQLILMVSVSILLFSMSWKGALLVVFVGVVYYFASQYIGIKVSYATGKGRAETSTTEHIILNEVFNGIKQIKVYLTEGRWLERFENTLRRYYAYLRKDKIWGENIGHSLWLVFFMGIIIIAVILRIQSPTGLTSLFPLFGTFAFAALRLLGPITNFGKLRMLIMGALPNAELVYNTLNREFTKIKEGDKELKSFTHNMQFDHVSFTHKGRKTTIKDVSITLEKGETTAIVGASGAGKTTIIDLLLRLFDPDKGQINIDGVNLKEYKLSSWLSRIGLVSQDTFIIHDSVKNNITFGVEGYSEEQIIQAAKSANAHDFIIEFPQGYDTIVGERGTKLSGGQMQRIAIARAIMKKPDILILDEATSALDNVSQALVQEAINKLSKDRTVVVVAHRLSTIIGADKIVVLENGRVMEEGTHGELMMKKGVYWNLYKSQEST